MNEGRNDILHIQSLVITSVDFIAKINLELKKNTHQHE